VSGRVGSGRVGSGRIGSGRVSSRRVVACCVASCRVAPRRVVSCRVEPLIRTCHVMPESSDHVVACRIVHHSTPYHISDQVTSRHSSSSHTISCNMVSCQCHFMSHRGRAKEPRPQLRRSSGLSSSSRSSRRQVGVARSGPPVSQGRRRAGGHNIMSWKTP